MVSRPADQTGSGSGPPERSRPPRRWLVRSLAGLGWTAAAALVFALFLRISLEKLMTSDGANNALQAWDLLHGNLVLHGFIVGDVTFYTFELPVIAILEFFLGLHADTMHVAEALIYVMVAAFVSRLRAAQALDAVEPELITTVQRAFEPTHVGIWVSEAGSVPAV